MDNTIYAKDAKDGKGILEGIRRLSEINWKDSFEELKKKCSKYNGINYVYKKCINDDISWIIVLEKILGTMTNEGRNNVRDTTKAKFRASVLKVVIIFNAVDPSKTINKVTNSFYDTYKYHNTRTVYEVGKEVYPDAYDLKIDEVCSNGIHYFKSFDAAYFYEGPPKKYTGQVTYWHDNGEKHSEGPMVNGKKHGKWIYWWTNGSICWAGTFVNDLEQGKWDCYDMFGHKIIILYEKGVVLCRYMVH